MWSHVSVNNVKMLSSNTLQTLAPHRGRYNVRTFFEEDMEIPIYEIPLPQRVEGS